MPWGCSADQHQPLEVQVLCPLLYIDYIPLYRLYTSSKFIGLLVKEESAEVLRKFTTRLCLQPHVKPHKKQLHTTTALEPAS